MMITAKMAREIVMRIPKSTEVKENQRWSEKLKITDIIQERAR